MRGLLLALAASVCSLGCATVGHGQPVGLARSGRALPELFLGGWDGKRLGVFDDSTIEPGLSNRQQLVAALKHLASDQYRALYLERSRLGPDAEAKGLFCATPLCIVVFEQKPGARLGELVAVFELNGAGDEPIGSIWLAASGVRAPGPTRWPRYCKSKDDVPHNVHADGAAVFPARAVQGGQPFAHFGVPKEALELTREGFAAPFDEFCDEEAARRKNEPEPERPRLQADPSLLKSP